MHIIASLLVIIVCPVDSYSGECENCGPVNGKYYCFYHYYGGIGCVPQNNGCSFTGEGCGIAYGCFLAGALVNTPNGVVPIEEIQVGDEVISMAENGDLQTSVVTETYIAINFDYYVINGSIQVTGTHPFKIGDGWVNAEEIEVGDVLSGINGEDIWVESVE